MQRQSIFQQIAIPDLNPDDASYTVATMKMVLKGEKSRLARKGKQWACVVLANISELQRFVDRLNVLKHHLPDGTRFQYIMKYSQHWTSADIRINKGRLEFFLMDSIHSKNTFVETINIIKKISDDAIITISAGWFLQMPTDKENCGTFAFDFARQMAKIPDLHEYILASAVPIQASSQFRDGTLLEINIQCFPPRLGALLRNMQDIPNDSPWFTSNDYVATSKQSVRMYVLTHGYPKKTIGGTILNEAVIAKRQQLKAKTIRFFNAGPEGDQLVSDHQYRKKAAL